MAEPEKFLTTIRDVTYPDGSVAACYAYVAGDRSVGVAVEIKRAMEMQRDPERPIGFRVTTWTPEDFDVWYAPDFNPPGVPSSVRQVPFD